MKNLLWGLLLVVGVCNADTIASMPNQGGGKIVLTNETCKHAGKTYSKLSRAYNYTSEGYTSEGCFYIEDESVVIIWDQNGSVSKRRYPAENFTIIKKSERYGT
jgi:hypothetical protein